jgi:hypothetical protein
LDNDVHPIFGLSVLLFCLHEEAMECCCTLAEGPIDEFVIPPLDSVEVEV